VPEVVPAPSEASPNDHEQTSLQEHVVPISSDPVEPSTILDEKVSLDMTELDHTDVHSGSELKILDPVLNSLDEKISRPPVDSAPLQSALDEFQHSEAGEADPSLAPTETKENEFESSILVSEPVAENEHGSVEVIPEQCIYSVPSH
jgi:hypothetical protein